MGKENGEVVRGGKAAFLTFLDIYAFLRQKRDRGKAGRNGKFVNLYRALTTLTTLTLRINSFV